MLQRVRDAKPEEIESIKDSSDLSEGSMVLALDTPKGTAFAVIRPVIELDPVHFPEGLENRWKAIFVRDVETVLSSKGLKSYYFNVANSDEMAPWREVVQKWGARPTSREPEVRFRKDL